MCSLRLYFIFVLFTLSQESILEKEDNDTSIDEESYDRLYFESKNDSFFSQDVSENNYEIQSDAATGGGIEEYNISKISDYLKELKEKNRKVKEQQEIEEALENNMTKRNSSVSLAFVFDSTGSMWDDLEQLKEGAGAIMTTMMERQLENPIYNYILVPFHDPGNNQKLIVLQLQLNNYKHLKLNKILNPAFGINYILRHLFLRNFSQWLLILIPKLYYLFKN